VLFVAAGLGGHFKTGNRSTLQIRLWVSTEAAGEEFHVSHPSGAGYGELIVTPTLTLLGEVAQVSAARLSSHPLFVKRRQYASPILQNRRAQFLTSPPQVPRLEPQTATSKLVGRTKIFLEAHACGPLRLTDVAGAVGASPAYLTDVFRRVEGILVHRHLVQLRLAKALVELPHSDDRSEARFKSRRVSPSTPGAGLPNQIEAM
jgi:AraC-like DNA-binding protein